MQRVRHLLLAVLICLLPGAATRAAEEEPTERFEVLHAGTATYSNVLVMNKTRTDVFIRHPGGLTTVKVRDLDKTTQLQLGYHLVVDAPTNKVAAAESSLESLSLDPRYEELLEQAIWEGQELWDRTDRRIVYGILGGLGLLYLVFCHCCHLLCRKTGLPASPLVWLPWLKLLPLIRAAGMSPWWFAATLIPGVNAIGYIIWSFKIAKARGKGTGTTILLLLPVFNVVGFLYLAWADRLNPDVPAGPRKLVTLSQPPRRQAA